MAGFPRVATMLGLLAALVLVPASCPGAGADAAEWPAVPTFYLARLGNDCAEVALIETVAEVNSSCAGTTDVASPLTGTTLTGAYVLDGVHRSVEVGGGAHVWLLLESPLGVPPPVPFVVDAALEVEGLPAGAMEALACVGTPPSAITYVVTCQADLAFPPTRLDADDVVTLRYAIKDGGPEPFILFGPDASRIEVAGTFTSPAPADGLDLTQLPTTPQTLYFTDDAVSGGSCWGHLQMEPVSGVGCSGGQAPVVSYDVAGLPAVLPHDYERVDWEVPHDLTTGTKAQLHLVYYLESAGIVASDPVRDLAIAVIGPTGVLGEGVAHCPMMPGVPGVIAEVKTCDATFAIVNVTLLAGEGLAFGHKTTMTAAAFDPALVFGPGGSTLILEEAQWTADPPAPVPATIEVRHETPSLGFVILLALAGLAWVRRR